MDPATASGPADALLDALLRADASDAADVVEDALRHGVDPIGVLDDVIKPAMYAVGQQWQDGIIGVTEEHLASSIATRTLHRLAPLLITGPPGSRPTAVMAAAQGERHVLGLQMACEVLQGAGYAVKYAGADLPAQALLAFAERERPALVGISCTGNWVPAADIRTAIVQLTVAQPQIGIVLGGPGWGGFDPPEGGRVALLDNVRALLPLAARLAAPGN